MQPFGLGADNSKQDSRTIKSTDVAFSVMPLVSGGSEYAPQDIEHQHFVGICTAISLTQNRAKAKGKKYSADFQYLLQKKYIDQAWYEGSSIMSALKVGHKFGFLPQELFTYVTEQDRFLPYAQYIAKLQAIPDAEVERLLELCVDKIGGYYQIDVNNAQALAKEITDSKAGILCRYEVYESWWKPSYAESDINPLTIRGAFASGHAIGATKFDYTAGSKITKANTWGTTWCRNGNADSFLENYPPTEAWAISETPLVRKFNVNLSFGMVGDEVKNLQLALRIKGFFNYSGGNTGRFGAVTQQAVIDYQKARGITPAIGNCYFLTRSSLNHEFGL